MKAITVFIGRGFFLVLMLFLLAGISSCWLMLNKHKSVKHVSHDSGPSSQEVVSSAEDDCVHLDAAKVALAYQSLATDEKRISNDSLFEIINKPYREAKDEFTRAALHKALSDGLPGMLDEAKGMKRVKLAIGSKIKAYDFEKKGFPTGIREEAIIPYHPKQRLFSKQVHYAVKFTNPKSVSFLPIPEDQATGYAYLLQNSRAGKLVVEAMVVGIGPDSTGSLYRKHKTLLLRITKLHVYFTPTSYGKIVETIKLGEIEVIQSPVANKKPVSKS